MKSDLEGDLRKFYRSIADDAPAAEPFGAPPHHDKRATLILPIAAAATVAALAIGVQFGSTMLESEDDAVLPATSASATPTVGDSSPAPTRTYTAQELVAAAEKLVSESRATTGPRLVGAEGNNQLTGLIVTVADLKDHTAADLERQYSEIVGVPVQVRIGEPIFPAIGSDSLTTAP